MVTSIQGSGERGHLGPIAALYETGSVAGLGDSALLDRFRNGPRDLSERAFEAIVARHGSMVLGVCRRALADPNDVEDAFQATFLVLARRASSVRGETLGRWLYGVSRKIAFRARRDALRRPISAGDCLDSREGRPDPIDEIGLVLDEEIGRLPARYGEAVRLCLLEGLALKEAADRLGCRVGTVGSRLNRARGILRDRLIRRGVATAGVLAAIESGKVARAVVPESWIGATSKSALSGGGAALVALASQGMGGWFMSKGMLSASALVVGLVGLATGAAVWGRGDGPQTKAQVSGTAKAEPQGQSVADQLREIMAEFEAAEKRCGDVTRAAATTEEIERLYRELKPSEAAYADRLLNLARTAPKESASRDALIWVLEHWVHRRANDPYAFRFARAATLLTDNHADDPDAVRVSFQFSRRSEAPNDNYDKLLNGFYIGAESREAKGLIRLAMAAYLESKASAARAIRGRIDWRNPPMVFETTDADGNIVTRTEYYPNSEDGYWYSLRLLDPEYLLAEAERMYQQVIDECGDIPYYTSGDKAMEAALKQPVPTFRGEPLDEEVISRYRQRAARRKTLGQIAEARLDELRNLVVGKPAPEIEALDIDGKTMKLSDFRGKTVALVFWESSDDHLSTQFLTERKLIEKYRDRPFVVVGVNRGESAKAVRKALADHEITWPQWYDGQAKYGPIASKYHILGYPSFMLIDDRGILLMKHYGYDVLNGAVDLVMKQRESRQSDPR